MDMAYGTAQRVRELTGVKPSDLGVADMAALDNLISAWLADISAEIDARINGPVDPEAEPTRHAGVTAVAIRTAAKMVSYAVHSRSTPIVQVGEFAVQMLNSSEISRELDRELRPYYRRKISLFHSGDEWTEEGTGG